MIKRLLLTLGLAMVILMLLFVGIAFAQGPITVNLALGQEDIRVLEINPQDYLGESASGDINGDGIDDLILGAPSYPTSVYSDTNRGAVYVFWGSNSLPDPLRPPSDANLVIYGEAAYDGLGHFIAVGDVNDDGVGDLIIGADVADVPSRENCGKVYVILGSSTLSGTIDLSQSGVSADVTIYGDDAVDRLGRAVASGDVNGDGVDDIVMGAYYASNQAGVVYAIFGSSTITSTPVIDLDSATADVTIYGADEGNPGDRLGRSVATGDVNGDGYADIIAGAQYGDPPDIRADAGETYVIYGSSSLSGTINLPGGANILLNGVLSNDQSGFYVTSGNLNGDSYDEIVVGAYIADTVAGEDSGAAYVVYGGTNPPSTIELSPTADVTIYGAAAGDRLSRSMSTGDVNGDGFDDLILGASQADWDGLADTGKAYVIYGGTSLASTLYLSETTGADIFVLGDDAGDETGRASASGDVNGDGVHDIILGAVLANQAGEAYVIYGPRATAITLEPASTIITGGLSVAYTVTATNAYSQSYDATNYLTNYSIDGAAGGTWNDNVYTTGNDGTWTVTATHRGLTDTAELLVDGTAPLITEINVTSDNESYFHNPGLTATGGTVYFNSLAGEGAGQTLTVVVTMTEANPVSLSGSTAFGTTPPADTNGADGWAISYNVGTTPGNQTGVLFTVTDIVWLTDQATIDFVEDNVAPTGSVTAPTGPYVNETQPAFTANANDVTSGMASVLFQYKLSSAGSYTDIFTDTAAPYQAVWGSTSLADGQTYDLRVIVTDHAGNVHTSEVVTVTCDTTDPESSASSPDYDTDGPIAVNWTASDATSGIDEVLLYVRAEGGSWANSGLPAQSGTSGTFNYTPPADGTYYFQTVAADNAGNQETVPSGSTGTGDDSTIYDTTNPTGSVTAPAGPYVNETQPAFTANADDVTSGVASVLFQYKLSSAGSYTDIFTDTAAPYQAVWGSTSLADGQTYDLRVIVTDHAGNVHTSEVVTVTCDTTDPESSASSPDYDTDGPIAVNWTASDATSGIDEVLLYVRAEGGSWANSGLPAQSGTSGTFNYTPPADGTYYFQTVAADNAGNQETVPSGNTGTGDDSTIYDTTDPTGSVTAPTGPYVNETQPAFTADADDATSGVASVLFQYKLSSAGSYTDIFTDTAAPYQAEWGSEALADGQTYDLRVVITDNAGNVHTSDVVTVICDISMPTMEPIVETAGQYYNSAPVFSNFGFDDNEDLDDGWYQMDSYTGTWTALFTDVSGPSWDDDGWSIPGFDALSEGSHTIYFRASDDVGNEVGSGGELSWQFYKDTTPPTMEAISEPQGQYYNSAPVFSNFGFDDGQALDAGWYQIDSYSGAWVPLFAAQTGTEWNENGWELPGFDSLSEGSHTVYFRARDDAGNEEGESGEWSWQFYKDTIAPTITYTSPTAGGTTTWYTTNPGAVIDVDFGVVGGSDLDYAQYQVGAGAWQTIFNANRSTDYTDTWAVDWSLLAEGENQISIRIADVAGNLTTHNYSAGSSGFLFRKDSLPPYINTVTVNSDKGNYFYNPGLTENGGTVYFNSVNGQGGGQVLTIGVTMTEANPLRLDGGTAFGSTPSDTNGADGWSVSYTVAAGAGSQNGVLFTVTDQGGHTDTATINFVQDNVAPAATVVTPTGTLTSISVIQGTATDGDGAGLSKVELQVTDGTNYLQANGSWSTSATWLTPAGLENWSYDTSGVTWAEVAYTIRVRTTDRVGNVDTDESTFTYEAPSGPMWYIYLPIVLRNY